MYYDIDNEIYLPEKKFYKISTVPIDALIFSYDCVQIISLRLILNDKYKGTFWKSLKTLENLREFVTVKSRINRNDEICHQ